MDVCHSNHCSPGGLTSKSQSESFFATLILNLKPIFAMSTSRSTLSLPHNPLSPRPPTQQPITFSFQDTTTPTTTSATARPFSSLFSPYHGVPCPKSGQSAHSTKPPSFHNPISTSEHPSHISTFLRPRPKYITITITIINNNDSRTRNLHSSPLTHHPSVAPIKTTIPQSTRTCPLIRQHNIS